jgi:hypothetical protein
MLLQQKTGKTVQFEITKEPSKLAALGGKCYAFFFL